MGGKHGQSVLLLELRICERFGIDPYGPRGPSTWPKGEQAVLLGYELVRNKEEALLAQAGIRL